MFQLLQLQRLECTMDEEQQKVEDERQKANDENYKRIRKEMESDPTLHPTPEEVYHWWN